MKSKLNLFILVLTALMAFEANAYNTGSNSYSYSGTTSSFRKDGRMSIGALYGLGVGGIVTYNYTSAYTIDAGFSYELSGVNNIHSWADFLLQNPNMFRISSIDVGVYYGGGVKMRSENDPDLEEQYLVGPRLVGGLNQEFRSYSIESFQEVAYTQYLTQKSEGEFGFNIGARYYF